MGYQTYFEIEAFKADEFPTLGSQIPTVELAEIFNKHLKSKDMEYSWLDDCIKWYTYDEDLCHLSSCEPDYVFVVEGDGEESDDTWRAVFHNGKSIQVTQQSYFPAINLSKIGLADPLDSTAPDPEPENQYFFAKE